MFPSTMSKPLSQQSMFDFFLRRFFPFFLIVPLVFFLIFHTQGRGFFVLQASQGFFWNAGRFFFFYLPLGLGILLTLIYLYEGQTNLFQYSFAGNWCYTFKRIFILLSLIYLALWFFSFDFPSWFHLLGITTMTLTVILLCWTLVISWGIVIH